MRARFLSVVALSVLAGALVLAGAPGGLDRSTASQRCGKITITYSYGSYRFAVRIINGAIDCPRAREVMKKGIPVTRPDPGGWECLRAPSHVNYSDVCRSEDGRKKVVARALDIERARAGRGMHPCDPPEPVGDRYMNFRANVGCAHARRVAESRRKCLDEGCSVVLSEVGDRRYRCTGVPNNMEGANWRCVNKDGRKRIVRWETGS